MQVDQLKRRECITLLDGAAVAAPALCPHPLAAQPA